MFRGKLFVLVPLVDQSLAGAAHFVELGLVVDGLGLVRGGEQVILAHEDGLFRAGFLTHAAVDAAEHVDLEFLGRFFHLAPGAFLDGAGGDGDGAGRADEFAELAGHAAFAAVFPLHQDGSPAVVFRQVLVPPEFRVLHRDAYAGAG